MDKSIRRYGWDEKKPARFCNCDEAYHHHCANLISLPTYVKFGFSVNKMEYEAEITYKWILEEKKNV